MLERALTHRSWCAEHAGTLSNERLEFLGDAVLGMVITDELFRRHPLRSEGWLSRSRSDLVRAGTLYEIALELALGDHIRLGKGEELTGGRTKPSILADAVEAVLGSVYLDGGMQAARAMVLGWFETRLAAQDDREDSDAAPADFKSRLQELCAHTIGSVPTYTWTESGPEHDKVFVAEVLIGGRPFASGTGHSKKQAEQHAAAEALDRVASWDGSGEPTGNVLERFAVRDNDDAAFPVDGDAAPDDSVRNDPATNEVPSG